MRWTVFKSSLDDLCDVVNKTIEHHEFSKYINSHNGCYCDVSIENILGASHELRCKFVLWQVSHADPCCVFSREEDTKLTCLAHQLCNYINTNFEKHLKREGLIEYKIDGTSHPFCVFHDPDCIGIEGLGSITLLLDQLN